MDEEVLTDLLNLTLAIKEKRIPLDEIKIRMYEIDQQIIATRYDQITEYLEANLPMAQRRFDEFQSRFDQEFPTMTELMGKLTTSPDQIDPEQFQTRYNTVRMLPIFRVPIILYILNLNSPALLDLHGTLERSLVELIPDYLTSIDQNKKIIQTRLLERRSLRDLSVILKDLDIWDNDDIAFIKKITSLRNAIAHKNAEKLSYILSTKKMISSLKIDDVIPDVDCISYIIRAIHLSAKIRSFYLKSHKKI